MKSIRKKENEKEEKERSLRKEEVFCVPIFVCFGDNQRKSESEKHKSIKRWYLSKEETKETKEKRKERISIEKELKKMASNVDQFADLELSKEDREQIFDDPMDTQSHTSQNGSR